MKDLRATNAVTYGLLACAAAISFLLPETLTVPTAAAAGPAKISLTGIIRDFKESHPDFAVVPTPGKGHYAGNVNGWLPGDFKPRWIGGGAKIDAQWVDINGNPIAPSVFRRRPGAGKGETLGIRVTDKIDIKDDCTVDSFSSTRGLYNDNGNYGSHAYLSTDSTGKDKIKIDDKATVFGDAYCGPGGDPSKVIAAKGFVSGRKGVLAETMGTPNIVLPEPEDTENNDGDMLIDNVTVTWEGFVPASEDDIDDTKALLYDDIRIDNGGVLNVVGDLRVICRKLEIDHKSRINLAEGANITFYVTDDHDVKIREESMVNVSASSADQVNTGIVTINYMGNKKVKVEKKSHAYMVVVAPDGELELNDAGNMYGSFVGKKCKLDNASGFHVDVNNGDDRLYNPAILVRDKIEFDDDSIIDGFDSLVGPYDGVDGGGTNYGDIALIQTNSDKDNKIKIKGDSVVGGDLMVGVGSDPNDVVDISGGGSLTGIASVMAVPQPIPVVTPPTMTVAKLGDIEYKNTTQVLATDLHCKKLKLEHAVLNIAGHVTIRLDDKLEMKTNAEIQVLPGGSLTIYVNKEIKLEDKCLINTLSGDPKLVSIRRMSTGKKGKIEIKKSSEVHAWIQGAKTELKLDDKAIFHGNFMGEKLQMKKSELHVDMAYLMTCVSVDDIAGSAGVNDSGGVTSAATFDQWFRDDPALNKSKIHTIELTNNGSDIYEYIDTAFRPIDDMLLGNEGDGSNSQFTYVIVADFIYTECGAQWIEVQGGDGAWMFVNGQLVLDIGGMEAPDRQFVEMDRMGLIPDEYNRIHFFYANRNAASKKFSLRTNIELTTERAVPTITAAYD